MKKAICLISVLCILFLLCACSNQENENIVGTYNLFAIKTTNGKYLEEEKQIEEYLSDEKFDRSYFFVIHDDKEGTLVIKGKPKQVVFDKEKLWVKQKPNEKVAFSISNDVATVETEEGILYFAKYSEEKALMKFPTAGIYRMSNIFDSENKKDVLFKDFAEEGYTVADYYLTVTESGSCFITHGKNNMTGLFKEETVDIFSGEKYPYSYTEDTLSLTMEGMIFSYILVK